MDSTALIGSPPISDLSTLGTVVSVWAHPDDETYLAGGVMAGVATRGRRVVCVTATSGDAGGPPGLSRARTGAVRRAELAVALERLGVAERHQLGYPDGGCSAVDTAAATRALVAVVDRVSPDTILTFGPDGMTGHPDHRAVNRWTTAAWAATGRRARLLYATTPPGFGARNRAIHERLQAFEPGLPLETPAHRMALRYVLSPRELDRKIAALRAHDSQIGPIERLIGPDALRAWWAEECFAEYAGPAR